MNTGDKIKAVTLESTNGQLRFPPESWTVLHIYEGDFLPVSATEILALDKAAPKFAAHGAKIYGISPDSTATHLAWILSLRNQNRDGKTIDIELISDRFGKLLQSLGMKSPSQSGTMIIDPNGIVRAYHKHSSSTGINVTEIERELIALQSAFAQSALTPSGWTPGEDMLLLPPVTKQQALFGAGENEQKGGYCLDWYICYNQDTGER